MCSLAVSLQFSFAEAESEAAIEAMMEELTLQEQEPVVLEGNDSLTFSQSATCHFAIQSAENAVPAVIVFWNFGQSL